MEPSKSSRFKPCPFCGGEADIFTSNEVGCPGNDRYTIKCGNCFCGTGHYKDPIRAAEAWNRRSYNEVIEDFQDIFDLAEFRIKNGDARTFAYIPNDKLDDLKIAISAMQELQAIHDNGISLERLKDIDFRKQVVEHINYMDYMAIKDELEEYKQIGTPEEVRKAMEKQNSKHPTYDGDGYAPDGTFVWDTWIYPNCGTRYEVDYDDYDYCPTCGQAIDWSDEI